MPTFHELSTAQLRQALQLREQIEVLQRKLGALLGGERSAAAPATAKTKKPVGRPAGKRTMSAEGRAKIAAAQKARWAKTKETSAAPAAKNGAKAPKKKGTITAAGRAKLAAAMKARWAARKKGAPALNAPAA